MTTTTVIAASRKTLAEWLEAAANRRTPGGQRCDVIHVEPGREFEALVGGSQTFGSGGYSAWSLFAGAGVEVVSTRQARDGFTDRTYATVRLLPGTVLAVGWGDCLGNDGRRCCTVYACRA